MTRLQQSDRTPAAAGAGEAQGSSGVGVAAGAGEAGAAGARRRFAGPGQNGPELLGDPAGYALAWSPGLAGAIAGCDDAAAAAELLLGAQAALGIPEGRRSPWTPAECEALVEEWLALEAEHAGVAGMLGSLARARARLAFLRAHLLALPRRLRPAAVDTLEALGLDGGRSGLLRAIAGALQRGNLVQAYSHALQGPPRPDPER
jgi:hypothetical protein